MDIREKLKQRNNPKKPLKVQLKLKPRIKKTIVSSDSTNTDAASAVSILQ